MKMELISLTLENFKGHDRLTIRFDGRNANIYGKNGVGKSSIYDSFTWLLFGKDSKGKKDFKIKPLNLEGDVRDHAAITSVEAVLRVDGTERKLKRTYYEVWSARRGSTEATLDGNSSDYFVDDVPCKKGEFTRRVGEIIEEDAFRLLTSITYFVAELPWRERRAFLFDVAAVATDAEILASDQRFAPLAAAMQGLSMDDYRKIVTAQRKRLNGARTDIPARLDECKKTVEDLSGIDFAALESRKNEAQERRVKAQRDLDQAKQDGGGADLKNRLASIRNELDRLENENAAYRLRQKTEQGQDETGAIQREIASLQARKNLSQRDLEYLKGRRADMEKQVVDCRAKWDAVNREQFQGGVCPTCGQPLPSDRLEASRAAFEQDKARRKENAVKTANQAKAALKSVMDDLAWLDAEHTETGKQLDALTARLRELESAPKVEIRDMGGYAGRKTELTAQAAELQNELDGLDTRSEARRKMLWDALAEVDRELSRLSGELSKKTAPEYANKRMIELREQAAAASNELNQVDQMLFLCDEFMRYKARFIEESINRRFSLVRFRLFRERINGGVEDCCDILVGGVPYDGGLNDGTRANAGIGVINTLSRHYGAQVPLFFDGAESVTDMERTDTQLIRLIVSENDKELRCELV